MQKVVLMIAIPGLALIGCSSSPVDTSPLEHDYGNSVHQMINDQVYDHATLTRPSRTAPEGADPEMLDAAVKAMRAYTPDRKEVLKPAVVNISGQSSQ